MGLFFLKAPKIGIDLGTSHIVVYVEGKGIVMSEPSIVARDIQTGAMVSIGSEALQVLEQPFGKLVISHPFKNGTIADYETTVEILKYAIGKVIRFSVQKPYLLIGTPDGLTKLEKKALMDAAHEAGVNQLFFLETPLAAAIGAKMPMDIPAGTLVVDIGGGITTVGILSFGRIISSKSMKIGGLQLDEAIVDYIKRQYSLLISARAAEKIKINFSSVDEKAACHYGTIEVEGKHVRSGVTKRVTIQAAELTPVLYHVLVEVIQLIKTVVEEAAPEVAADLITQGIVLTGGGAQLRDIDTVLAEQLQVPVQIADNPIHCVAEGLGESLKAINLWKKKNDEMAMRH